MCNAMATTNVPSLSVICSLNSSLQSCIHPMPHPFTVPPPPHPSIFPPRESGAAHRKRVRRKKLNGLTLQRPRSLPSTRRWQCSRSRMRCVSVSFEVCHCVLCGVSVCPMRCVSVSYEVCVCVRTTAGVSTRTYVCTQRTVPGM